MLVGSPGINKDIADAHMHNTQLVNDVKNTFPQLCDSSYSERPSPTSRAHVEVKCIHLKFSHAIDFSQVMFNPSCIQAYLYK